MRVAVVPVVLSLVVQSGGYSWAEAAVGVLALAVGTVLAADYRGAATQFRDRRARFGSFLAGPVWSWRAWGVLCAVAGVMMIVQ
jgi:hypothetical protein